MRPTCPYAGLPVTPCVSKVMADCCFTHHTSHCSLWWAYILYDILYGNIVSCKLFVPLPPPEWLVPIVGIIATNNGCTCQNHHFGCGNALLMSLPANGCGVLLCLKKTVTLQLILFCQMEAMVAGLLLPPGNMPLVRGVASLMEWLFGWFRFHPWSSEQILPCTVSRKSWLQHCRNCSWCQEFMLFIAH